MEIPVHAFLLDVYPGEGLLETKVFLAFGAIAT